jgi:hypothetical protein
MKADFSEFWESELRLPSFLLAAFVHKSTLTVSAPSFAAVVFSAFF